MLLYDIAALLQALRHGELSFCSTVQKHMGRKDSAPVQKLGKHRVMWMLGASPEDPVMLECIVPAKQRSSKRKRRKRKEANELEAVASESSASDKMSCGKESDEDKDGDQTSTLAFLAELRKKKRQKNAN